MWALRECETSTVTACQPVVQHRHVENVFHDAKGTAKSVTVGQGTDELCLNLGEALLVITVVTLQLRRKHLTTAGDS